MSLAIVCSLVFQGETGIGKSALLNHFRSIVETSFDVPVITLDTLSAFCWKKALFDLMDGIAEGFSCLPLKQQSSIVAHILLKEVASLERDSSLLPSASAHAPTPSVSCLPSSPSTAPLPLGSSLGSPLSPSSAAAAFAALGSPRGADLTEAKNSPFNFELTYQEAVSLLETVGLLDSILQLRLQEAVARERCLMSRQKQQKTGAGEGGGTAGESQPDCPLSAFAVAASAMASGTSLEENDEEMIHEQAQAVTKSVEQFELLVQSLTIPQQIHRIQATLMLMFRALTRNNRIAIMCDRWNTMDDISLELSMILGKHVDSCLLFGSLTSSLPAILQEAISENGIFLKNFCTKLMEDTSFRTGSQTVEAKDQRKQESMDQSLAKITSTHTKGELIHFPLSTLPSSELSQICCEILGVDLLEAEVGDSIRFLVVFLVLFFY